MTRVALWPVEGPRRLWLSSKSPLLCIKGETANASNSFQFIQQCERLDLCSFLGFTSPFLCAKCFSLENVDF